MGLADIAGTAVSNIKSRDPVRVKASTPTIDVVIAMREGAQGAAIVEDDDGKTVGIFTDRDAVVRPEHAGLEWHSQPVSSMMTESPLSISSQASVSDALRVMHEGGFRHLPIVDRNGRALSITSIRDILVYLAEHFPQEFINLPPDPDKEASGRWGG